MENLNELGTIYVYRSINHALMNDISKTKPSAQNICSVLASLTKNLEKILLEKARIIVQSTLGKSVLVLSRPKADLRFEEKLKRTVEGHGGKLP